MNTLGARVVIGGLALIITLISGVILSNSGKPYAGVIFTIHKLIAVGAVIVVAADIYQRSQVVDMHALAIIAIAVTGLLFLALIVSGGLLSVIDGGLLSLDKRVSQTVLRIHQAAPLLVLVSSAASVYLLAGSEALSRVGMAR